MPQTRYDFGGNGRPLHMALANGFPPQTYAPLLNPLTDRYQALSFPPRPLWTDPPPAHTLRTWQQMADDLLSALDAHALTGVIGVGHSMGAVATLLAALESPQRFAALVLLDPTIFPPSAFWTLRLMRMVGLQGRFPLVNQALRRRAHFENEQAAFDYWRGKRLFKDWADDVLWLYVQGLTQPAPDGGIMLSWSPLWESRYYATIYTHTWRKLPQLEGRLPILVIRGTTTNTFLEPAAARFRRVVPSAHYAEIEGHGHLFPQSAPTQTHGILAAWLQSQGL